MTDPTLAQTTSRRSIPPSGLSQWEDALVQLPVAANQPTFGAPNTNTMGAMHG